MTDYFLSVCIPTYNRPDYLKKCLESIVDQRGFERGDIEVLIIDNASKFDILAVVEPFLKRYKTIRFLQNKSNIGFERNILKLLRLFRGKYFFFLSDDDRLLPGSMVKLKKVILENPSVSVFAGAYKVYPVNTKKVYSHRIFAKNLRIAKSDIDAIVKFYSDSQVYSRICLKKDVCDIEGYRRHIGSMYSLMYPVGKAALSGESFYLADSLILHTAENLTDWEYTVDYMARGKIGIIKDLSHSNAQFYEKALRVLVNDFPDQFYASINGNFLRGVRFVKAILEIDEIRESPQILLIFAWKMLVNSCIRFIHKIVNFSRKI